MTGRVLTVENMTDTELGFVLCRKRDDVLHLHIADPDEVDEIHGKTVRTFDPPDQRTFLEEGVVEVDQ